MSALPDDQLARRLGDAVAEARLQLGSAAPPAAGTDLESLRGLIEQVSDRLAAAGGHPGALREEHAGALERLASRAWTGLTIRRIVKYPNKPVRRTPERFATRTSHRESWMASSICSPAECDRSSLFLIHSLETLLSCSAMLVISPLCKAIASSRRP